MWKPFIYGVLVLGSAATQPSMVPHMAEAAPASEAAGGQTEPRLLKVPAKLLVKADHSAVTLSGWGLSAGTTLTLSNEFHTYTFGVGSIDYACGHSLKFDAATIADGVYDVSVRSATGVRSDATKLEIAAAK